MDSRGWLDVEVSTPALLLDRPTVVANLYEMVAIARDAGIELFPHAKTHRMPQLAALQIAAGSDGLCVAKLGEAEVFAAAGVDRIFVAYPVVGVDKARRALALSETVDLTLGTDSVEAASSLGAVFAAAGATARLVLAIDTGLGREGVSPADAPALAARIAELPGVELVGIYTHEGSTYAAADPADLVRRSVAAAELMVSTAALIRGLGIALPVVSLGSSASARAVAGVPGVTQIRPGIYASNDLGQIALGNASLESTGIRVIATVVSHPDATRACIDAGSKSLSTDLLAASALRDHYPGHGLIVNAPGWIIERMSEEHGWLAWVGSGAPTPLPVGTRLEIVPNHACMAFAMLRRATVLDDGVIVDRWDGMGAGSSE